MARRLGGLYFDLEQESDRLRLDLDFAEVLRSNELVILDEAQAAPEIFERLRGAIDGGRDRMGRFLLLGSVSPTLMTQVSESLAGRLALVELTPFTSGELDDQDSLWLRGGYPDGGVLGPDRYPIWQRNYLGLLAARDLPLWGLAAKPQVTDRLFRMLAAVHGQQWNASKIGQGLGLTHPTVNTYTDQLEGAFLLRRLRPWQSNLSKRLTKRPRLYWRDSGLLHALEMVRDREDLLGRPWVGASWEGFVIEQIVARTLQLGIVVEPWYFRTSDQKELDLLLDFGAERWAIEIKLTANPTRQQIAALNRAADLVGAERRFLVTRTPEPHQSDGVWSCTLENVLNVLDTL